MSLQAKIRRGEGPVYGLAKSVARRALHAHIPVGGITRGIAGALYGLHVLGREGWIWLLRFFWYEPLFRSQCEKVGTGFKMEQLPYLVGNGRIVLGNNVRLSGKPSIGFNNRSEQLPELRVGDGTFIGHACGFNIGRSIRIGANCLLASGVHIQDQDGHPLDARRRRAGEPTAMSEIRPVEIGDDVWIASGAMILKGVRIGDRAIVGARAVVTRDVPPDTVVAGNPARVVKQLAVEQGNRSSDGNPL